MKEKQIENQIKSYVAGLPASFVIKWHGSSVTGAGVPDLWGAYRGVPFAVEVKAKGNAASTAQRRWVKRLRHSGYISAVVYSLDDFVKLFEDDIC